jgi:prepilin-type N-terminal cleavage/methylation domain-containing protein
MLQKLNKKTRAGFTLVEIMIVVAIIALLAAIAVPNFLRARKRSQASRVLEDLRMIDAAIDQYAIERNKASAASLSFDDLMPYFKQGTALYTSSGKDMFQNNYNNGTVFTIDGVPKVNTDTYNSLSDVAPSEFWSPFK